MNKNLGILHLSDIHASLKNKTKLQRLLSLLQADISTLIKNNNIDIKFVCITGDLINSGDNSNEELDVVFEIVIEPLMEFLNITENNILIVPGNHEIKRSEIVEYIENGLLNTLKDESDIENFMYSVDTEAIRRISYFDNFMSLFGGKAIFQSNLARSYIHNFNEIKIGFVCLNSAWRSTGIGIEEKGKMIIGKKQIVDSFESIKTADLKVCLMHHPLDWLVDVDKLAIEKCINEFDIILNGHIHESKTKIYTSYNGQCVFNTCGKFDNSSDIYNGYSILSLNPYNKDCDIILRQYFDYPRNCYDEAINLVLNGKFSVSLGKKDDLLVLAYNVAHCIENKFIDFANSFFISNVVFGKKINSFDESFILPTFSKYSEYEKETQFDELVDGDNNESDNITLDEICSSKDNLLLLGKKEIGKTTILHYMVKYAISNFDTLKMVPIIIDCLYVDFHGKNIFERESNKFINEYCDDDVSFSMNDITNLLKNGNCIVMFDNFETVGEKQLSIINKFINTYPKNKYIFSEKETVSARSLREVPIVPNCNYKQYHICSLSKEQIRSFTQKSLFYPQESNSSIVDKIMLCFKTTTLPKTPFVLSVVLSLCNNSDFVPINEAVVMELFMESLLEKTSPIESSSKTYDFRAKENFLLYLVTNMYDNNRYYFTHDEFRQLAFTYHDEVGFSITDTKFDKLFFEKGILIQTEQIVSFRYTCMIEYYIAKKAEQNQTFLNDILKNKKYLNYSNELLYYTGLNRCNNSILNILQQDLYMYFDKYSDILKTLDNYNISMDISFPEEEFSEKISNCRLSQSQSDILSDTQDFSEKKLPEKIDKTKEHNDMNAFVTTLLIYGSCVKNLEFIKKEEKITAYQNYTYGLCILLAIMKNFTEESFIELKKVIEKSADDLQTKTEKLKQTENHVSDIVKIALPLYIQNIALENIGTSKLKLILKDIIQNSKPDDFSKFFSVFTYCDLRISELKKVLAEYVNEEHNKALLKIIFFKLLYYYQFRYFNPSLDTFLEETLANINVKLNNGTNVMKGAMIKEVKKSRKKFT